MARSYTCSLEDVDLPSNLSFEHAAPTDKVLLIQEIHVQGGAIPLLEDEVEIAPQCAHRLHLILPTEEDFMLVPVSIKKATASKKLPYLIELNNDDHCYAYHSSKLGKALKVARAAQEAFKLNYL